MTKINKNINVNSIGLTSNIKKSESNKEEKLKRINKDKLANQVRQAITRQKAILRDIKDSPPVNQASLTNKISDPSKSLKEKSKPLPKPPAMMSSSSSIIPKSKSLPDTPNKNNFLPHNSLKMVARNKPLPPVPTKSHTQPQIQSQPQPQMAILTNTLDVGLIAKQMKLFKNAINSQDGSQAELLAEQLNRYASDDKKVSADICREFAMNVEKLARPNFNFTPEIKHALVQFASAWIAMKSAQGDPKGSAWDIVINTMALSIQEKSKEWGMEF
jgi:hypothetical protein